VEENMAGIFGKTLADLMSVMNYRLFRQGIISSNIANIDTPGYKARDASFDEELTSRLQLATTRPNHLRSPGEPAGVSFRVKPDPFSRIGNDSNTVDLDREMMKLTQNQILYEASSQMIQSKIEGIKNAIRSIG
jgi:flagellar basal-body rod protein FlgB